jgi:hypothetical protein
MNAAFQPKRAASGSATPGESAFMVMFAAPKMPIACPSFAAGASSATSVLLPLNVSMNARPDITCSA